MIFNEHNLDSSLKNARELFINGKYETCELLLEDLLRQNINKPEVYQMLATISYDNGKFNKAIKLFKRALEIDPAYIDAYIGLSIIYNDLGRYEEGEKEFSAAKEKFSTQKIVSDPFTNELLAKKHEELGDIYFSYKRYKESLDNFVKAKKLNLTPNIVLKIADANLKLNNARSAVLELRAVIKDSPHILPARQKLAEIYYDAGRVVDAIETWESILLRDPNNLKARNCLKLANSESTNKLTESML